MRKLNFAVLIFLFLIFVIFAFNSSIAADEENKPENKVISDEELITALVKNYKEYVAKGDAQNLIKILSADSAKNIEKELTDLKKVLQNVPPADLDKNISALGKTAKEILAMNVESFLSWALSRLTDWDKEDLGKAELNVITISEDGNSAELSWSKANVNEAPAKAVKEDNAWKIVISIS